MDLEEHHHFLPSSNMGVLEVSRVDHGTDPLGLLSNLWKQGKNIDKGKDGKEGGNAGEMFEIISNPNKYAKHLLPPSSPKVTKR